MFRVIIKISLGFVFTYAYLKIKENAYIIVETQTKYFVFNQDNVMIMTPPEPVLKNMGQQMSGPDSSNG